MTYRLAPVIADGTVTGAKLDVSGSGGSGKYLAIAADDSLSAGTPAGSDAITANTQTASYTLVLGDAAKAIEMNVASANNLTVPPDSSVAFPVGTVLEVLQYGAGQTTIVAAGAGDVFLAGEAPGEADNSVQFTTTTARATGGAVLNLEAA